MRRAVFARHPAGRAAPAVVLSAGAVALGVVRGLGEAGIRVVVLRHGARDVAHLSRHVAGAVEVPAPGFQEEAFVEALVRRASELRGALLVPASAEALAAVSRHKERLAPHYVVAAPDGEVTRACTDPRRSWELAARAGLPVPSTLVPSGLEEARAFAARVGFPLLARTARRRPGGEPERRTLLARSGSGLDRLVGEALGAGVEIVLQELIPGPDSEVVDYWAYAWSGRPLVEFTARQLRKAPPRIGAPRVEVSEPVPDALAPGRALLRALGLEGLGGCELKRDPRDRRYKVLGVRAGHGRAGLLALRCGINFPLIQYRHLMYGELPEPASFTAGVYCVDAWRDAGQSLRHLLAEHYAPWRYLAPYLGPHCDAVRDRADPGPGRARTSLLWAALLRALRRSPGARGAERSR